jgi:hypothetical protein
MSAALVLGLLGVWLSTIDADTAQSAAQEGALSSVLRTLGVPSSVRCGSETASAVLCLNGDVLHIRLMSLNLAGSIATQIALLSALTSLNLFNNSVTGTIPTELKQLRSLDELILSQNYLTGRVGDISGASGGECKLALNCFDNCVDKPVFCSCSVRDDCNANANATVTSTSATATTATATRGASPHADATLIAGAVVGALLGVLLLAALISCCISRRSVTTA